jgi:NAD-dependent deacetylase
LSAHNEKFVVWEEPIQLAAGAIRRARHVAVMTGAGISAESGLKTFRDAGGLWEGHRPEDVATPEAFARDPLLVWRFYNARRRAMRQARPNAGHTALVDLSRLVERFTLITQNVDRLHRRAGSNGVIELHGNLEDVACTRCHATVHRPDEDLPERPTCNACGGLLRPAVVWFGESLPQPAVIAAQAAAEECDVFLVAGTSRLVYPAAGLTQVARSCGACVIEINLAATGQADADLGVYGPAGQTLPAIVAALRSSQTGR